MSDEVRDRAKRAAAEAALSLVEPGSVIGVGTGSTANHFIEGLGRRGIRLDGAVASSRATAERLAEHGIRVLELNDTGELPLYVDGADEVDPRRRLIKGGGAALTREKIVATASVRFVCIVDESKLVDRLGAFPLPVEILPFARLLASREIRRIGGNPTLRDGLRTDNGNEMLDVRSLDLGDPDAMESTLNLIPGVIENGLFCHRRADVLIVGGENGARVEDDPPHAQ